MAGEPVPPRARRVLAVLRSPELGLVCGAAVVVLLALGSFAIAATRDGASSGLRTDEVLPFFEQPSAWHAWFYLLLPICALYALNTILCTWDTTVDRWKKGQRSPWQHGPAVVHVGFLLALLAHLVGALGADEGEPLGVTAEWTDLGDGRQARVVDLRPEAHPNGQLKQLLATLEVREGGADAPAERVEVGFNRPLFSRAGSRLLLLAGADRGPVVFLRPRDAPGIPWALGAAVVMGLGLVLMGRRWL
jgi:hypothetical protein